MVFLMTQKYKRLQVLQNSMAGSKLYVTLNGFKGYNRFVGKKY